jgi:hypothetical protein
MEGLVKSEVDAFIKEFPETLQKFVKENFHFLYKEKGILYFIPPSTEEGREFMTANKEFFLMKSSLLPKMKKVFNIENAVIVKDSAELVFFKKAVEICNVKKIEFQVKGL